MNERKGTGHNGVKDIAVYLLTKEWPLTVQQLYEKVLKERPNISYHAVHKACQQLVKAGVLRKERSSYSIATEWLERISMTLDGIKRSYIYNRPLFLPGLKDFRQEGETRTFTFENLEDAENYRKRLQWEYLMMEGEKKPYCATAKFGRSPLFSSERALNIMNMATRARSKAFILCAGASPVDEWCADYYRNEFVKIQTGADCAQICDTAVLGDVVVQLYLPDAMKAYIETVYASASSVSEINVPEFHRNVYLRKAEVKLTVIRNGEIAEQLRQQIMARFKTMRLAAFDINAALVDGFLLIDFAEYFHMRGHFDKSALESMHLVDAMYRRGETAFSKAAMEMLENYALGLRGQKADEIPKLALDFVSEGRLPLFPYARIIFNMVASYCHTLGFTIATSEISDALKSFLPFDEVLASRLEVKGGAYTGRYELNLAAKGKGDAVISDKVKGLDLRASIGFGNGNSGGFLERVEVPVIVTSSKRPASGPKGRFVFSPGEPSDRLVAFVNQALHSDGALKLKVVTNRK